MSFCILEMGIMAKAHRTTMTTTVTIISNSEKPFVLFHFALFFMEFPSPSAAFARVTSK